MSETEIENLVTLRDWIRRAASRFNEAGLAYGHGTANALDEAAALVLQTLHLPPDTPDLYMEARLTEAERRAVAERVERRIDERVPLPYLTGEAWFAGLAFEVDERVLIPRSPIAELIERGFEPWVDPARVGRILDIGTGSGCIAIACAVAFPHARVDAVDSDAGALELARRNAAAHGVDDRVELLRSDLFEALEGRAYELIVANPPYVDDAAMAALPPEYRHEPAAALAGGPDGLDYALAILRAAARFLTEDGVLVLEVGGSAPALAERCPRVPFTWPELERGGTGVCLLTREDLAAHAADLEAAA